MGDKTTKQHTFFVDAASEGVRVDAFATSRLPDLSRSRIQHLIASGELTLDGGRIKPAVRVRRGQRVDVRVVPPDPSTLRPEAMALDIVYEDADLLVINKPPGLTVHPGSGRPGGTLANALLARLPELAALGEGLRPGIVHRLDKDTSGLLVVARSARALMSLRSQLASRSLSRTYLALVHGRFAGREGTIDAAIGRHPRHRTKMAVVPSGRPAVTRYRVVESFQRYSLLEVALVTGRTHQIRVHVAHLGHPVAGDRVYGRGRDDLSIERQALHAWRLRLQHPASGEGMAFEAPPPPDFTSAVAQARAQGSRVDRRSTPSR
ncbi:MAG TPA: RluA family pseudouridine synthase [bacterium]